MDSAENPLFMRVFEFREAHYKNNRGSRFLNGWFQYLPRVHDRRCSPSVEFLDFLKDC